MKFESLVESDAGVECELTDVSGEKHIVNAEYARWGWKPRPKSNRCRSHRWARHIFFTNSSAIIAQDEVDTWTVHTPVPLDFDVSSIDPKEAVYRVLGGSVGPYPIEIDEILVTSSWRPNICLAAKYISHGGRVFLSGDAAHQNIPFDIGWKLAAVLSGYGGPSLLQFYEVERRPVAARNIEHSGVHWQVHAVYKDLVTQTGDTVISKTAEGDSIRAKIAEHMTLFAVPSAGENCQYYGVWTDTLRFRMAALYTEYSRPLSV
ncbi:hypothetical protein LTS15_006249 [Exophiala xenobiotica]|nr:hypothetical protein LTS15_006249 [Exophiala xenobiotica]